MGMLRPLGGSLRLFIFVFVACHTIALTRNVVAAKLFSEAKCLLIREFLDIKFRVLKNGETRYPRIPLRTRKRRRGREHVEK
jgi:hypothetical protein